MNSSVERRIVRVASDGKGGSCGDPTPIGEGMRGGAGASRAAGPRAVLNDRRWTSLHRPLAYRAVVGLAHSMLSDFTTGVSFPTQFFAQLLQFNDKVLPMFGHFRTSKLVSANRITSVSGSSYSNHHIANTLLSFIFSV